MHTFIIWTTLGVFVFEFMLRLWHSVMCLKLVSEEKIQFKASFILAWVQAIHQYEVGPLTSLQTF